MDDGTIDIEEVADSGDYIPLEEDYEELDEFEERAPEVIDYSQTLLTEVEKITIPYMTKYEKSLLIGVRAQQLNNGSIPTIEVGNLKNTALIAEKELMERKLPLMVRRHLPNGEYEDWKVDELIIS